MKSPGAPPKRNATSMPEPPHPVRGIAHAWAEGVNLAPLRVLTAHAAVAVRGCATPSRVSREQSVRRRQSELSRLDPWARIRTRATSPVWRRGCKR